MPESYRIDLVKSFIEPVMRVFGCRAEQSNRKAQLQIENLSLHTRPILTVYRIPSDRPRARLGILEGPVMGISCRGDLSGQKTNSAIAALHKRLDCLAVMYREGRLSKEQYEKEERNIQKKQIDFIARDLMQEIGAMLQMAQDRSREGKEEVVPGKGKWWAEKPRYWGGKEGERTEEGKNQKKRIENELEKMKEELKIMSEGIIYRQNTARSQKKNVREDIDKDEQENGRTGEEETLKTIHRKETLRTGIDREKDQEYQAKEEKGESREGSHKKRKRTSEGEIQASQQECEELQRDGDGGHEINSNQGSSNVSDKAYSSNTPAQKPQSTKPAWELRKERSLDKWAKLEPPSPRWDSKVSYIQIGKAPEQEEDVVSPRPISLPPSSFSSSFSSPFHD